MWRPTVCSRDRGPEPTGQRDGWWLHPLSRSGGGVCVRKALAVQGDDLQQGWGWGPGRKAPGRGVK